MSNVKNRPIGIVSIITGSYDVYTSSIASTPFNASIYKYEDIQRLSSSGEYFSDTNPYWEYSPTGSTILNARPSLVSTNTSEKLKVWFSRLTEFTASRMACPTFSFACCSDSSYHSPDAGSFCSKKGQTKVDHNWCSWGANWDTNLAIALPLKIFRLSSIFCQLFCVLQAISRTGCRQTCKRPGSPWPPIWRNKVSENIQPRRWHSKRTEIFYFHCDWMKVFLFHTEHRCP